ncbi:MULTISPECIES: DUF1236 domain-containing protein [unclassified Bradyrhizobium]|uniref:DUF1236 domain-containing protein n=1 Tax=unclassified Bradyrhizobium TaxID=2631580 RepID=UPI002FEF19A8
MRKQLLLSTGIICLMLAPAVSFGQAPGGRGEEQKQMRPSEAGKGAASQERGAERTQGRAPGAEQKTQGAAGREDRGAGSRQSEEKGKAAPSGERPSTASDDKRGRGEDAKSRERAQDSRQGGRDAQTAREGKDAKDSKGSAEMDRDKARSKSSAEQEKSKGGTSAAQKQREGTPATQKESGRDRRDGSKGAAEQDKDAGRPSTATDTTRTQPPASAQTAPAGSTSQSQTGQTQTSQQSNISTEKQVRISQTLTRERLAPPERNLNIAIRIGEPVPPRVRFHRLPPEIVSIEPEYRDYEYFSTDDDIVIVEPRTKRIVSQIPRDASRIRAAGGAGDTGSTSGTAGYTSSTAAAGGASPCRIMRRDTAGNVTELTPQTVGSAAQQEAISVTVRVPGGATTAPISMGAQDGQIVVSGQSGADCMVTIEPPAK